MLTQMPCSCFNPDLALLDGHHQMVNTEIKMIAFFVAEDGEAVYNQLKQDWELTVAQITNLP